MRTLDKCLDYPVDELISKQEKTNDVQQVAVAGQGYGTLTAKTMPLSVHLCDIVNLAFLLSIFFSPRKDANGFSMSVISKKAKKTNHLINVQQH